MKLTNLWLGLGLLVLSTSCTVGTEGLFASIEREQAVTSGGTISKYATINRMAELNTKIQVLTSDPATVDIYLATGGAHLFERAYNGTTWNGIKLGGSDNTAAVGVAGSLVDSASVAYAIANNKLYQSTDGTTWTLATAIMNNLVSGDAPFDLIPVRTGDGVSSNDLVLVTQTAISGTSSPVLYGYGNVYLITGSAPTTVSGQIQLQYSGSSQVWNLDSAVTDGSTYYFLNDTNLWSLASGSAPATGSSVTATSVALSLSSSNQIYGGMLYLNSATNSTGPGFYFAAQSSGLNPGGLYYVSGASPTGTAVLVTNSHYSFSSRPVSFGQMMYNSYKGTIWAGTLDSTYNQGNGYAEITLGSSPSVSTYSSTCFTVESNMDNYTSTVLPTSIVYCFFAGSQAAGNYTSPLYFLGTGAEGLWTWSSSTHYWSQQ